jgi:tetratricopeptide (TPR) repeat protein
LAAFFQAAPSHTVCFENVHAADGTDQELIAVLLRRVDPGKLRVCVESASRDLAAPLLQALHRYAHVIERGGETRPRDEESIADARSLAENYVASHGTSDDPRALRAYERLDPALRRELHAARARALEKLDERTLGLGAIPYHLERAATGVAPFVAAAAYCMRMAYYEACLDLALRGAALVDEHSAEYGSLARNILFSLLLLDRLDEVVALCKKTEVLTDQVALRSHCAYAMAILYARVNPNEKRDYEAARAWVKRAIELAELVPDSETQVVNLVFLRNTLALVEMRTGNPLEARDLLSRGLARLKREAPSRYRQESIILLHNRARIHVALGEDELALLDFGELLAQEPTNSEGHLDRGIIYQRLGRYREALDDYELAAAWSPPYDEAYFNRAQMRSALGRKEEAIADYGYVLDLEPGHLGALIHRAGLLFERGDLVGARADIDAALMQSPHHAKALSMLGLIEMGARRWEEARRAFDASLASDASESTAWINRATLLFRQGDRAGALHDLDRALQLGPNATASHNRARILKMRSR